MTDVFNQQQQQQQKEDEEIEKLFDLNNVPVPIDLNNLIEHLHKVFSYDTVNIDYVKRLLENYKSNQKDWKQFAKYDPYKYQKKNFIKFSQTQVLLIIRYTRNLVNKGNGKFNIIILCWSESQGSSIHDHSNAHCFFKMLDGELTETKFDWPVNENEPMIERDKHVYKKDQVSYINGIPPPSPSFLTISCSIYKLLFLNRQSWSSSC